MKHITLGDLIRVTQGELICGGKNKNLLCDQYCFDTRQLKKGDIHVGIFGEEINGGIYYEEALKKGAIGSIVQDVEIPEEKRKKYENQFIIKVPNTLKALAQIAIYKRSLYPDLKVVAVTGSVGKTSTKDLIASVVSQKYTTLKTQANFNNQIGVPMTILSLTNQEALVIEMGMNHQGEIAKLTKIAKPNICIITNVGTSHIGNLGSRENILKAKLEILEGCQEKQIVINNDNDMLHEWYEKEKNNETMHIHTFGIHNDSQILAKNIQEQEEGSSFDLLENENESTKVFVPVGGEHFVYNALCAITVGKMLNLSIEQIKQGIATFELTHKRMEIIQKNEYTIINDAYNASYESMKASLTYIATKYKNNRKIAVLGDMLELGNFAEELHRKVGKEVAQENIDILICAGENSQYIIEEAKKQGMQKENIYYFHEKEQNQKIIQLLKKILQKGDVVLVKASNSMKFFQIAEEI